MEELLENLIPLYNKEFYLAHLCGEDVVLPIPDGNAERYLAYLCGMDVTIPDVPDGRTETYLAYKCGEDVVLPDPMYRIEFYLAKWCGMDVEVPEPMYRIEYWLAQLANSGELKTVTGNPISISDALAKPAEALTIEILPLQDLHGYSNPWLAGGGKNKFDISSVIDGAYISSSGVITEDSLFMYSRPISVNSGNSYTLSFTALNDDITRNTRVHGYDADGNWVQQLAVEQSNDSTQHIVSFTIPSTVITVRISIRNTFTQIQVEEGAYTSYAPYSNICPISGFTGLNIYHESAYDPDADPTYAIDWQDEAGTVYGGSLDVTTGVLTVTNVYKAVAVNDMNNSESYPGWRGFGMRDIFGAGHQVNPSYLCDSFKGKTVGINTTWSNDVLYLPREEWGVTGQTEFKQVYGGHVFGFVFPLAAPITYQLTPTEIQLLLGNNVIWNDVGDMVLEYWADGPADDVDALQILLGNRYVNNGEPDEATDREALDILLGGNTR